MFSQMAKFAKVQQVATALLEPITKGHVPVDDEFETYIKSVWDMYLAAEQNCWPEDEYWRTIMEQLRTELDPSFVSRWRLQACGC
jgi:hypothetical protein